MRSVKSVAGLIVLGSSMVIAMSGCSSGGGDDDEDEKTESQSDGLAQGGCSNAQIRQLQAGCRESCSNGSRGIDHCYPGTMTAGANVFLDVSEGGICVCR